MTEFAFAVVLYAAAHTMKWVSAAVVDAYPRRLSTWVIALGAWAAYSLLN